MTEEEYKRIGDVVDGMLGHPEMTWEGPEPHDFRQEAKNRGVRFINSGLFYRIYRCDLELLSPEDVRGDSVEFAIHVNDEKAKQDIQDRLLSNGLAFTVGRNSTEYETIRFFFPSKASK